MPNKTPIPAVRAQMQVDTGGSTISSSFTLRDTFAMYALMSFPLELDPSEMIKDSDLTEEEQTKINEGFTHIIQTRAKFAYMQADAMIAERAKSLKYKRKGEA